MHRINVRCHAMASNRCRTAIHQCNHHSKGNRVPQFWQRDQHHQRHCSTSPPYRACSQVCALYRRRAIPGHDIKSPFA